MTSCLNRKSTVPKRKVLRWFFLANLTIWDILCQPGICPKTKQMILNSVSRLCENSVGDFCTSAHLKALKLNLNALKKANGLAFGSAEVQKSTREFSNGLNFSLIPIYE